MPALKSVMSFAELVLVVGRMPAILHHSNAFEGRVIA
jgi:hypothetical protein